MTAPPPPPPRTHDDVGIPADSLCDLILKTLHRRGTLAGFELAHGMALPYPVIDDLVAHLREHRWIEVRSSEGGGPAGYRLALSQSGAERARAAMARTPYAGPAPVSLDELRARIREQSARGARTTRDRVREAFADLVLPDDALTSLGPAVSAGRSFFLFGPPGNGKTAVATRLGTILGDPIYLPYAVEVDGEVIAVYDPALHRRVDEEGEAGGLDGMPVHDRRWVRVERPVMIAGGELQLEDLDLRFDPIARVYRAPLQLKAMGGALVLDDFGRQRADPAAILSRWILPLEYEIDYLTLHTGFRFEVPFDCLLVFASNGDPAQLGEEAFMRRIQYKVHLDDPSRAAYSEIFSRELERFGYRCELAAVDWLYSTWYEPRGIPPRACHPRDLLRLVGDYSRYEGHVPRVDANTLSFACGTYFAGRGAARKNGKEARA